MTSTGFLSSAEALEHLGLYNPASGKKPDVRHLSALNKKGLLKRFKIGYRTILYKKKDCDALLLRAEKEGLKLTR